jgi:SAM-dependent methyltransferase
MLLSNFEYVPLRILRRFLFSRQVLDRIGAFLPYYLTNWNESGPDQIVADYRRYLAMAGQTTDGATVVEVGSGRTNSVGYLLAALGAARVICLEPFASLDRVQDEKLLNSIAGLRNTTPKRIADRVDRVHSLIGVRDGSVDIVLSSSVLEHIKDLDTTLGELKRVSRPAGAMLHVVDYRDHFFKYPYHFLQFSRATWEGLLDPGDLPRWRLSDHVIALRNLGYKVTILDRRDDPEAFRAIKPRLAAQFDPTDPDLAVTFAAILARTGTSDEHER